VAGVTTLALDELLFEIEATAVIEAEDSLSTNAQPD
jgi:hypothetical protein